MLRRATISTRLTLMAGLSSLALVVTVVLGFSSLTSAVSTQGTLNTLADAQAAAQTVQYDFADFNGWQTAYAFDVTRLGAPATEDDADSRATFLAAVDRTRADIETLRGFEARTSVVDGGGLDEVVATIDEFMAVDQQIIDLYRTGVRADRDQADALILGKEIELFTAGVDQFETVSSAISEELDQQATSAAASGGSAKRLALVLGIAALLVVVAASFVIARSIRRPVLAMADAAEKLADGDFDFAIETAHTDEPGRALAGLERMKTTLTGLIEQMNTMAGEHDRGETGARIAAEDFSGAYREVAAGVNAMVASHLEENREAIGVVSAFGQGDFSAQLRPLPGRKAFVNEAIDQVRANLEALIADTGLLAEAAVA
ncbi:MAG: HAMP domain-containing protein, partial [Herbiconiux sp.]|nr:HAMP domain-containing protein [Herbiconiux sp.]